MVDTIFVRLERLRRLHKSHLREVIVQRGPDGTFGLGLTEDNEIIDFHHDTNAEVLHLGDQVRRVGTVPLVRERLAVVIQREYREDAQVVLQIARRGEGSSSHDADQLPLVSGEVFANLCLRRRDGSLICEWSSDLWKVRTNAVWGACWTLPLPQSAHSASIVVHRMLMLSDKAIGVVKLSLRDQSEAGKALSTHWLVMREPNAAGVRNGRDIVGEALVSVRRYQRLLSVSPAAPVPESALREAPSDDEEESKELPAQHCTEPIAPIFESTELSGLGLGEFEEPMLSLSLATVSNSVPHSPLSTPASSLFSSQRTNRSYW